jgi:hypothetical protein
VLSQPNHVDKVGTPGSEGVDHTTPAALD